MNTQTAIAERPTAHPIVKLGSQLEQRAAEFKKALPSHISPEKLQRTVITAAQNSPDLLTADRASLITACMKAAQDGLLPDGREAALVIFNNRERDAQGTWYTVKAVAYMPMVYGLRKKIVQSGEVVSLQTGLVYRAEMESGHFIYEVGMEPPIRHRPKLDLTAEESNDSEIVAAYSIARMKDGSWSVEVMRRSEIDKVREASQTGATRDRKGQPRQPKGPWVDWFGEMARKTVMRRHSKTLPMTGDIIVDVEGQEQDASISTMRALAVEPDAPKALPRAEELDDGETVDTETGEVTTDSRGMTDVEEETARQLDAGEDGEQSEDPAEENRDAFGLEPLPETQADTAADAPAEESLTDKAIREARAGIKASKNASYLKGVEDKWLIARGAVDDATASEIDGLIAAKRRELSGEGGK
jgi:recombination protein RecT